MINSESTSLPKHESFALLERYLHIMARDPDWTPSAESLIELRPAFTEECAGALAELLNRFEMAQEMVRAYIELYDAYVVTLYDAWATGGTAIDYSLPEIEAFFDRVVESFQYLERIHEASGNPSKFAASMHLINHGLLENGHRDCTFELYTPSPTGEVLRDRFDAELPSAVLAAAIADSLAVATTYSFEPRFAIRHADFFLKTLQ